jgi:hypothetical protein
MTAAGSSSSFSAFATADAGFEYLATAEHYQHLAKGILDALRRGCLVLVTGDPPASPPMLTTALREAVAPRAVIELSCGPDLDCEKLFGGGSMHADTPAPSAIVEEPGRSALPSPIFVFANADRLSDRQIEEFREATQTMPSGPHGFEAGVVLLAHSDFVARAESAELHLLDEGGAAHLRVQQLERDEVEAFILHQLPPGERTNLLTPQRVALIAITSGGNPAAVNRLARRMLEIEPDVSAGSVSAKLLQRWRRYVRKSSGSRSVVSPDASTPGDEITPRRVAPRRYAVSLRLPAGIVICLGAVWLAAAFESQRLDVLVGLVHDRILPRHEQAGAPGSLGAAPSAEAAISSSSVSVNLAVAPPSAAPAGETTLEPVATSADHPGATSAPPPIPEPAEQPVASGPRLPAAETAALVGRGDAFLAAGDIASARLFFERAADLGDSRAAMRVAVTYDAAFLDRAGLHGLRGDPEQATLWYRRARELGEGNAEPPHGGLGTSGSAEPLR